MYIKENPILGKMFRYVGLKLNEKGLWYQSRKNGQYKFFLTDDHVRIVELLRFDFQEFDDVKENEQFFELLYKNPYFYPGAFLTKRNHNFRMLHELAEFISSQPEKVHVDLKIEDLFEPLKDLNFEARYLEALQMEADGFKYGKIDGRMVLFHYPEFDKMQLGPAFQKFNASFLGQIDRCRFFSACQSDKEMVDGFLKIVETNLHS